MASVQIFLSAVSAEFRSYRDALRRDLDRPNVTVKIQEDFIVTGTETLDMLDEYIHNCHAVIHLVGDMTGALAQPPSVAVIRERYPDFAQRLPPLAPVFASDAPALSYTQWEAWLALYHRKVLVIAVPQVGAARDERYQLDEAQCAAQQAHLAGLARVERYPGIQFANADRLAVEVLRSKLQDILALAGPADKPNNLPFRSLGDMFKGREAQLDELNQTLGRRPDSSAAPAVARVLNGMAGVGKTRLALEYAWRRAGEYSALLFVGAASGEALQHGLAALCASAILNLPEQTATEEAKQRDAVLRWLRQHPGWLLILDNIDSKEAAAAAEELLPKLTGGHVLLTSRLADWSGNLALPRLEILSLEAASDFLLLRTDARRRKQSEDPTVARALATELGRLALALEQAGAYISHQRLGFADYLALWKGKRDKVLTWFDPRLMQYDRSVAITWQASFDQLTESARRLLRRLAWFAPEPVPASLLGVPVSDDAAEGDPFDALAELDSYSLATRAADSASFSIHRLVQEVTRRSQRDDPAHAALGEALRWINEAFVGDPGDVRNWPVLDPLAAHVQAVAAHADAAGITEPTARLMNEDGLLLLAKAQYAEAERPLARALAIWEKALGPGHPDVATGLNNLALLYRSQGAYTKAELLHERALAIREKALDPGHPDVANSLNNLARLYADRGAYTKAEPLYERALAIREKALGPEHPDVAQSLNNLASLYNSQGTYAKAEPLYERALAIREKALGPEHPNVATSLNNLAGLYDSQGAYAKAEPLYERSLAIREKALGPEHPDVAQSLNNLAGLYDTQGAYAKAELLYERALAIFEKVLGPEHPDLATSLNNLADLYDRQGAYAKAEPLYERAVAIREKVLGPEHPGMASSLNNLAELYRSQGAYEKAEPLYKRALAIGEKALGPEHLAVAASLNNLALLYFNQGAYAKAEPLMRRALASLVKNLGSGHPSSRTVLDNYTDLLHRMGKQGDEIISALRS
jgi:tetratricopeptide (TPR) repeat protein